MIEQIQQNSMVSNVT